MDMLMKVCKHPIPIKFFDVNWYLIETPEKILPKLQKCNKYCL